MGVRGQMIRPATKVRKHTCIHDTLNTCGQYSTGAIFNVLKSKMLREYMLMNGYKFHNPRSKHVNKTYIRVLNILNQR